MAETDKERREANREAAKLVYDMLKHVTTLATGTVVILATFIEKIFKAPIWMPLIVVTFISLVITLISALGAMLFMAKHAGRDISNKEADLAANTMIVCFLAFLIAMASLTTFAIRNFLA